MLTSAKTELPHSPVRKAIGHAHAIGELERLGALRLREIAERDGDLETAGGFGRLGEAPEEAIAAVLPSTPIRLLAIERDVLCSAGSDRRAWDRS